MNYNDIIEYEITTDLATEPVSLIELKRHLNMLFDTSGAYVFDDDDTYLTSINKSSRQAMEKYTGLSFGSKTIVAILKNDQGGIEIPFGPLISITSIKDSDGTVIPSTEYTLIGSKFKKIVSPTFNYLEVTYVAGYTTLPEDLKLAIMHEAAYRYNSRYSEDGIGYCKSALELAAPYKRTSFLV